MSENKSAKYQTPVQRCAYCGAESPIVWVHGHGQCANCGINIEECCRGEQCAIIEVKKSHFEGGRG